MEYKVSCLIFGSMVIASCDKGVTTEKLQVSFSQECIGKTCDFTSKVYEDTKTKRDFIEFHKQYQPQKDYKIQYDWNLGKDDGPSGSYLKDTSEISSNLIFKFNSLGKHDVELVVTVDGTTSEVKYQEASW